MSEQELRLRKSTVQFLETDQYKGISNTRIHQFLHSDNHQNEALISIIKKMDADLGKDVLIRQLKATSKRIYITNKLNIINAPTLFIGVKQDALVSFLEVVALKDEIPNSLAIVLKNCGHMIPLEKPKEIAEIINNYLNQF